MCTYNDAAGYDERAVELRSLDKLGEAVLPQSDYSCGTIVEGFESLFVATGQEISGKITKHLGSG